MIRFAFLSCAALFLFAVGAQAEDHPPFTVISHATRSADDISVSIKIMENNKEFVPNIGSTNVTTTKSAPRIKLRVGQRALMIVGRSRPIAGGTHPASAPADIDSGIKVDVISIKGRDDVLIVTTVVEDGSTVWAEAATVKVQLKPAGDQK